MAASVGAAAAGLVHYGAAGTAAAADHMGGVAGMEHDGAAAAGHSGQCRAARALG